MKTKLKPKHELADAWTLLKPTADAHGIVIGQSANGCGVTRFYAFVKADPEIKIETSHFGGFWDFNGSMWLAACEEFVKRHAIQQAWNRRQHKHAINRAYEKLCDLAEVLGIEWCLKTSSLLACDIIKNPSDLESGLEIIATDDGLVELHADNLPTIGGKPSKRWNYTVVTVHGGGGAHDDPPPAVDESKPLSIDAAVRAFAVAAMGNKVTFANLDR